MKGNIALYLMIFLFALLILIFIGVCIGLVIRKRKFIENAQSIRRGMLKFDVIGIMGDKYSHSYLQDDLEKLEWCYRENGSGVMISNGVFITDQGTNMKISVIFRNNMAIEVNVENIY